MKALNYTGPKTLKIVEIDKPTINDTEILMKIKSVGICGTDLHIFNGGMDVPTPLIQGHEFVGVVDQIGKDVKGFNIGDKVVAEHVIGCGKCEFCLAGRKNICINPTVIGMHKPGALQEYLAISAELVYKLPENMSFDEGVLVEPVSIGVYALEKVDIKKGADVIIIGQGPIGLFLDQLVQLKEPGKVIGVDIVDSRLSFSKEKGFIDYGLNSKDPEFYKKLFELMPNGADVIFEAVGNEATAETAIQAVKPGGRIVMLGVFERKVNISMMRVVRKEIEIVGSWTCLNSFPKTIELIANKKINLEGMITHRYKFEDSLKAFEESNSYSDSRIKTVIEFD